MGEQSVQVSPLTNWVIGGGGAQEALVSSSGMGRMSMSISSAGHSVAHPLRFPKDGFGEAVVACDMPTLQISIS